VAENPAPVPELIEPVEEPLPVRRGLESPGMWTTEFWSTR
jgi:hypothetical protein